MKIKILLQSFIIVGILLGIIKTILSQELSDAELAKDISGQKDVFIENIHKKANNLISQLKNGSGAMSYNKINQLKD
jgi:hypothetical protein